MLLFFRPNSSKNAQASMETMNQIKVSLFPSLTNDTGHVKIRCSSTAKKQERSVKRSFNLALMMNIYNPHDGRHS